MAAVKRRGGARGTSSLRNNSTASGEHPIYLSGQRVAGVTGVPVRDVAQHVLLVLGTVVARVALEGGLLAALLGHVARQVALVAVLLATAGTRELAGDSKGTTKGTGGRKQVEAGFLADAVLWGSCNTNANVSEQATNQSIRTASCEFPSKQMEEKSISILIH